MAGSDGKLGNDWDRQVKKRQGQQWLDGPKQTEREREAGASLLGVIVKDELQVWS